MKTLIIYTTKYGSVKKSADILTKYLNGEVTRIDLRNEKVPDLEEYDRIILGGSIYVGKVQKELTGFAQKNQDLLLNKTLGLFINSGEKGERNRQQMKNSFPPALFEKAVVTGFFGDEIDFEKCSFIDRMAVKMIKKTKTSFSNIDENAIREFADRFNNIQKI